MISIPAYHELRQIARQIENPQRTLVVAAHGLEWWAAWVLHTHVAQPRALSVEDWKAFDNVLVLTSKAAGAGIGRAGPVCIANTPSTFKTLTFWSRGGALGSYD